MRVSAHGYKLASKLRKISILSPVRGQSLTQAAWKEFQFPVSNSLLRSLVEDSQPVAKDCRHNLRKLVHTLGDSH